MSVPFNLFLSNLFIYFISVTDFHTNLSVAWNARKERKFAIRFLRILEHTVLCHGALLRSSRDTIEKGFIRLLVALAKGKALPTTEQQKYAAILAANMC